MDEYIDPQDLKRSLETLRSGGLLLYPTDTIWGIGCDALNRDAIRRINQLKGREADKNLIILLDNENNLQSYVSEIPEVAYQLIEYSEHPLTIIYSGAKNLPEELIGPGGTIGIRIVNHPFCRQLIQRFRRPIVSTSANFSGKPAPSNFQSIDQAIKDQVDYVAAYGQSTGESGQPSIIMKLDAGGQFDFIRK